MPYLQRRLGHEPLERSFTAKRLAERLAGRRAPLKAALLDQRTVAGLGNIYVDEALWRAQLHPLRPAGTLDADELTRLHEGDSRRAPRRHRPAGGDASATTRLPTVGAGATQDAFKRVRPRRGAVPALRNADRQDPRGWEGHLVLPQLPASGREPLGEPAFTVEPPQLRVAADRLPSTRIWGTVQPPVRSKQLLPEGGVAVERDLLVLDPT